MADDKTPTTQDDNKKSTAAGRRTTGLQCSYWDCENRFYTLDGQRTAFHFFGVPKKNPDKLLWCNKMGKVEGKDGFSVTKYTKICHEHFASEDILKAPGGRRWSLRQGVRPRKHSEKLETPLKRKAPTVRADTIRPRKLKFVVEENLDAKNPVRQPKRLKDLCLHATKVAYQAALLENKRLKETLKIAKEELKVAQEKLRKKTFGVNTVNNEKLCKHYTGFPNYDRFQICFQFLCAGSNGQNVIMKNSNGGSTRRPRALTAEEQFLLTIVRLRSGYSNIHLGWLFGCDESTVSRTVCSWVNFMFLQFSILPIWPSREDVNDSMPDCFKTSFPNTRVIVDCTEVFVESPESLHLRSTYYSDYKHHNTYKALIGITPAGSLSFVSELFPGSVSDREIVTRCGILNPQFWDVDDEIMADKGFTIRDLLNPLGVKLNIPEFLEDKGQFSVNQVCVNQKIAAERIHVERYIARVKNFGIFNKPIPLSMHGSSNQIFTVCSFLVMFQDPIISA